MKRDPFLPPHPDDYLTPRRRWAPIVFLLLGAALGIEVGRNSGDGKLANWLLALMGVAVAVQAVDALRTGKLLARFPNLWPLDAERGRQSITFWSVTVAYLVLGSVFVVLAVSGIAPALWRWITR